ncbi:MAG: hypothetical protein LBT38_10440, partial [Deltaproteobacteria bacterium]|nr:hypothetical protein [Deltaproteobacteria bacterium]
LYKKEAHEETLWSAALEVLALCVCLEENMADWGEDEELIVATNYSPKNFPLTHATIQRSSPNLERVLNLRALLQTNHTAFQARLKGAITQAGLDSQLAARRLIIFRFDDYPKGQATSALTEKFADLGGILIQPKDEDLRKLGGLATTWQDKPRDLEAWLKRAKPTETIASLAEHIAWIKARP